jgi:uncharacterized iron-regulated membrane protein
MPKGKLARWLHLSHRWLGIMLGLMVLLWFISGLVMLFVARPQLDETERLAGLPPLDVGSLRISPSDAWQSLGLPGEPELIRLNASGGQAAYRILINKQWHAVNAENGQVLATPDSDTARQLTEAYAGQSETTRITSIDVDQWTVYRRFDPLRPFWHVELADGRSFYISTRSGELALDTTASERAWNWVGSVVHWIYITPLRQNTPIWRNIILWSSFLALVLTVIGFWLGWQRLRLRNRYSEGRITPYRAHWKRWHHFLGLAGGIVLFTWLISGWLSMAPMGLATAPKKSGNSPLLRTAALDVPPDPSTNSRELEWLRLGNSLVRIDKLVDGSRISLDGKAAVAALSLDEIESSVRGMGLGKVTHAEWLQEADNRYFSLRHHPRDFPVARIELDDPDTTVLYISPRSARIEVASNRHDFVYRWLYHGLHRLDLPVLVAYPLLRDIAIIALSLLGIALSLTGCVLGWRRMINKPIGTTIK